MLKIYVVGAALLNDMNSTYVNSLTWILVKGMKEGKMVLERMGVNTLVEEKEWRPYVC